MMDHQPSFSHHPDYSLYRSNHTTNETVVFYPGMACNRFGHPFHNGPKGAVEDLVSLAHGHFDIIFPEIHMRHSERKIDGLTIEDQNRHMEEVLSQVESKIPLDQVTFVGQSLGCLAVTKLVRSNIPPSAKAVLWGPPTLRADTHKDMLVSKFASKKRTYITDDGSGIIEFGNDQLIRVDEAYWDSIESHSLVDQLAASPSAADRIIAVCASRDNFYPNNAEYFTQNLPGVKRIEIEGESHTFKEPTMRLKLKNIMDEILIG